MLREFIFFLALLNILKADYYISFDFVVKNGILNAFNFNCSLALTKLSTNKKYLFSFYTPYKNIKKICNYEKDKIVENLLKYEFHINSTDKKIKNDIFYRIKGVFLPERFDIIVKGNRVYFYLKEED